MSQENVELFRRGADAWDRGDLDELLALYDAEAELDFVRFEGWVERPVFRGRAAIRAFFEQWREAFADYRYEVERYVDAGERVLALCSQSGAGPGSTGLAMMRLAQIATFKDGLIVRMENYSDREQALDAVGLSE
jgi:ketosteroid isomerase-like protein